MKSIYLKEILSLNDSIERTINLMVKEKTESKNDIEYILGDITKEIPYTTKEVFNIGDIVAAKLKDGHIETLIICKGEYEIKDYIPHSPKDINSILSELEKITTDTFVDKEAISLNNYFFSNKDFIKEFSTAIGGFGHHIYVGGLAEHTLNVVYLTDNLAKRYSCKFRDIAVLAAKLHDIGKIYEYSHEGTFKSTFRGEMEGHIIIGISMVEEAFKKDSFNYSEGFKNRLKGCIVQHHGMPEYGSPKNPNTQEAYIVHFADYVDATMNKIWKVKSETKPNSWSEFSEELKTKLFI